MTQITALPSRRLVLAALAALGAGAVAAPRTASARQAADLARVDALIGRMTIQEKAGQLNLLGDPFRFRPLNVNPLDGQGDPARVTQMIRDGTVGNLFNGVGAEAGRRIQTIAVEESRLGIPLLFAADIIHGLKTVFPVPLAEAAAFDADLARRTARAAGLEGAASAIHQTYAPMVDVARDQRWGRVVEGAGEDVYLNNVLAAARVRGFQGEKGLADRDALLATPKHFAAYSAAIGGMEYNTTDMSEATLRGVFLPPFKAAFDAGALSTMSAFNDLNGVPASGNHWLLTEILRDEWGFEGFVVSDYTSENELIAHGFAADGRDAARIALLAGVDMSMVSGLYLEHIPDLVDKGDVPMARVDQAVRRVLLTKAALGLFDDPYRGCDPRRERAVVGSREHRDLAREAGVKSIVLLKNEGGVLPLKTSGQKIALIGPFGDDVANIFGPWTIWGDESRRISLEAGFREAMADGGDLMVVKGCEVEAPLAGGIEAATLAAARADVVVLALGETANMSGEAQSRTQIDIPEAQRALAEAVAATGKPVVVLLRNGRAMELSGVVKDAEAIVVTWFLGGEMGHAVADVVFGKASPSGRLPVSFPHRSGQQPYSYDHKTTGRPADNSLASQEYVARYRETTNTALYPFGHGLTYGAATYGPATLSAATLDWDGSVEVSVAVTNTGERAIVETVQLYIHDRVASLTQPGRRLRDFRKVALAPGESRTVTFTLARAQLEFVGAADRPAVEPGLFDVWLTSSAQAGEPATLTLGRPAG
ncbi:MAG: glycoside hydrolase family 3 C-terminal domain-containing protein [Alphaproteobacteria bacterium]|nr:glycoside hydrolase family 3 C-terminal domain-containing protein [Alphaproteobacteria bacterium]MBU2380736.1 glycoside hydrolase family 3 C-terminal domain-containing protein [Alphaproteobacteria bacterium]